MQCARKEVKRRKKHTDSEEEYRGRGRGGGRGQGEHEPLQGLSRTSPKPAASNFFSVVFLSSSPPPLASSHPGNCTKPQIESQ